MVKIASYSHIAHCQTGLSLKPMISGSDCMKDDKPPHICERCYREQKPAQEYVCERKEYNVDWVGQGWVRKNHAIRCSA